MDRPTFQIEFHRVTGLNDIRLATQDGSATVSGEIVGDIEITVYEPLANNKVRKTRLCLEKLKVLGFTDKYADAE